MYMKRKKKVFSMVLLMLMVTTNSSMAGNKEKSPEFGIVRGRVIDNVQQTLPGASIYIEKLQT